MKLVLVIEPKVEDEKQCHDCGWHADDPYGLITAEDIKRRREIIRCSTCAGRQYLRWKQHDLAEKHLREDGGTPAICDCGYSPRECQIAFRDCGGIPIKPGSREDGKKHQHRLF